MPLTFEALPNELIMTIFQYTGDVHTILRTFLGLNQRLNRILLDTRMHLFTDVLVVDIRQPCFRNYYKSIVFQELSHELLTIGGPVDEHQLHQCFQSLISFHIQEEFKRFGDELQSNLATFDKARRQHLTNDEIMDVDNKLNQTFHHLRHRPINMNDIQQIELLVLQKGARLQCEEDENSPFNFAMAINRLFHSDLNNIHSNNKQLFHLKTRMFQLLILSNPNLLTNRDYFIYSPCSVWYFLFYAVYQAHYHPYRSSILPLNMECYKAAVNLLLFTIHCQKFESDVEDRVHTNLFFILNMILDHESVSRHGNFVANAQWEILKIITDSYVSTRTTPWSDTSKNSFQLLLGDLIKKNRIDVILFIYRHLEHVRCFFNQLSTCRIVIDLMTGNKIGRQLLETFINEKAFETWATTKDLVFILLQKKERKLLEKLVRLYPFVVHQLDDNENDPLLHLCLKVHGCRHRLVEFLIRMKADLQRTNFNGQNFYDAIKLPRNDRLLEKITLGPNINTDSGTNTKLNKFT